MLYYSEQNKTFKCRSRLRTNCGKIDVNDYREKPNFQNRYRGFGNSGMLHVLRLDCHQGWHVYIRNQKHNHVGKISYVKIGKKFSKTKKVTKLTKIKMTETLVFPIVKYGSKSWTRSKKIEKTLMLLNYKYSLNF